MSSKKGQSGWEPTKHRTKRPKKRHSRSNLENALAHARDMRADAREQARKRMLGNYHQWQEMSPAAREQYASIRRRLFSNTVPPVHPDTPAGEAFLADTYTVKRLNQHIRKLEAELAATEGES